MGRITMSISSADAQRLVASALTRAAEMGLAVSVAVIDTAGFLVAFGRSDGAGPYTTEVAQSKAYGVVFMGRTSAQLSDLAQARPQFFDAVKTLGMRTLIPSPGGVPVPGGAIGVSGAPKPELDVEIADAAIATLDVKDDLALR
jgi:uncharacterized protein GlcG (DUF336 family)